MEIIVDGINDLITLEETDDSSLKEFFDEFAKFVSDNQRIVCSIKVDEREIVPPFVDDIFAESIQEIGKVEIETVPITELSKQTLEEVEVQVEKVVTNFKQASEIIYSQKYEDAVNYISNAVDMWKQCQQALNLVTNFAIQNGAEINKDSLKDLYGELNDIIIQLSESIQNKDFMMVKDVIDYELLDKFDEIIELKNNLAQSL